MAQHLSITASAPGRRPRRKLIGAGVCAAMAVGWAAVATPASAEIVKAPTGASSKLTLNSTTLKTLKRNRVSLTPTGAARKSRATLSLPYSLSRWDFGAREGDVVHFTRNTGFRLKRKGGRSIAMVHPRVILDGANGYVTALISGVRVKTFTFKRGSGKVSDQAGLQRIAGLRVKLTKASADMLNKGLRRKALRRYSQVGTLELNILRPAASSGTVSLAFAPGQGTNPGATLRIGPDLLGALPIGGILSPGAPSVAVDVNGDGQADTGVFGLPLKGSTFSATTRLGTISLDGGLIVRAGGADVVTLDDPEIVVGATPDVSGLFALVNGVRVKVGDIDTNALNVRVGEDTVNVTGLNVRAGVAGLGLPGLGLLPAGTPLLTVDLSLPQR